MTGLVRKATLFGVCAVMAASVAMANVPDPTNSTCPSWIFVVGTLNPPNFPANTPDPFGRATITVRDFANNPISGAVTEISFRNACDINLCPLVSAADVAEFSTVIDCDSSIVRGNTNAAGQFSFTIVGSAKAPIAANTVGTGKVGSVIVFANDRKLCSATGVTLDLNGSRVGGNQGPTGGDLGNQATDVGQYGLFPATHYAGRSDLNCSGTLGGNDIGVLASHVGRYGLNAGSGCPGGLASLCKTNKCPAPF
jgi:hypothetical protein